MNNPLVNTAAVVGLGLIGGSVALGLKEKGLARQVIGYDLSSQTRSEAVSKGVVSAVTEHLRDLFLEADLIVLAVPVLSIEALFIAIREYAWAEGKPLRENLVITDVGSVKGEILAAAARVFGEVPSCLVPAHPIAGSERNGVAAARSSLFAGHKVIVTPHVNTSSQAESLVNRMWRSLGADVISMEVAHHDEVLAGTSHLPHLLAYALVDTLSSRGDKLEIFKYAAGGFSDFTRIAASDPEMWRDIFKSNAGAVLEILDTYINDLHRLRQAIAEGDAQTLTETFQRAKVARDYFSSLQADS